jgi:hypothetical protein
MSNAIEKVEKVKDEEFAEFIPESVNVLILRDGVEYQVQPVEAEYKRLQMRHGCIEHINEVVADNEVMAVWLDKNLVMLYPKPGRPSEVKVVDKEYSRLRKLMSQDTDDKP